MALLQEKDGLFNEKRAIDCLSWRNPISLFDQKEAIYCLCCSDPIMKGENLTRRCLEGNTTDAINRFPTLSFAKALFAQISSTEPQGFSPRERRDQLQLVRRGGGWIAG